MLVGLGCVRALGRCADIPVQEHRPERLLRQVAADFALQAYDDIVLGNFLGIGLKNVRFDRARNQALPPPPASVWSDGEWPRADR